MQGRKQLLPALKHYLRKGGRKVRAFLVESGELPTFFDDEAAFPASTHRIFMQFQEKLKYRQQNHLIEENSEP